MYEPAVVPTGTAASIKISIWRPAVPVDASPVRLRAAPYALLVSTIVEALDDAILECSDEYRILFAVGILLEDAAKKVAEFMLKNLSAVAVLLSESIHVTASGVELVDCVEVLAVEVEAIVEKNVSKFEA